MKNFICERVCVCVCGVDIGQLLNQLHVQYFKILIDVFTSLLTSKRMKCDVKKEIVVYFHNK